MANAIKILDDIIRTNPELAGALKFVKGELEAGNISNEAAMRSANYAERTGRARKNWKDIKRGGKAGDDLQIVRGFRDLAETQGAANTARESVRDATSTPAFNRIDERMRDFDLKGTGANIDHDYNKTVDHFAQPELDQERISRRLFDEALSESIKKREEALGGIAEGNDMGFRRAQAGLEDNKIETWYANARKSGLNHGDAVKEAARFESDFRGEQVDPAEINSYIAKYFPDLMN